MKDKLLFSLRILAGWVMLQGGVEKLMDPSWTSVGYLKNAIPDGNPLMGLWGYFANVTWVDPLVVWGLTLGGIALIFGVFVRWTAYLGSLMMLLFWLTHLHGGLAQGLPLEHGWVVSEHVVYIFLMLYLAEVDAGKYWGLYEKCSKSNFAQKNEWFRKLLS